MRLLAARYLRHRSCWSDRCTLESMDAPELRQIHDANRQSLSHSLKRIREPLYTHVRLASLIRRFIDHHLKRHRDQLIETGTHQGVYPMHVWLAERLMTLYPEGRTADALCITPADREDLLNLKINVLEEYCRIVSAESFPENPWPDMMRQILRLGGQERICAFFAWDQAYIRQSLLKRPPEGVSFIHAGGLSDLLEVIGYFTLQSLHLSGIAHSLSNLGVLRLNKGTGVTEIHPEPAPHLTLEKRREIEIPLRYALNRIEQNIEFFWTRYDLHVVMETLFGKTWAEAPRRFRVSDRYWEEISKEFTDRNSMKQMGKDVWLIRYEDGEPFTVTADGIKYIVLIIQQREGISGRALYHHEGFGNTKGNSADKIRKLLNSSINGRGRAFDQIRGKSPELYEHLKSSLKPEPKRGRTVFSFQYRGDKYSYLNVKPHV